MRKILAGAAALGVLAAIAIPGTAQAAKRQPAIGVKADQAVEVGAQYRRRAYYRPYRVYARPLYGPRYFARGALAPGYYPAWYTPYYDDYGYPGYGYGYGYRPFISIGVPGFGIWF
jgi:hypothetical protein